MGGVAGGLGDVDLVVDVALEGGYFVGNDLCCILFACVGVDDEDVFHWLVGSDFWGCKDTLFFLNGEKVVFFYGEDIINMCFLRYALSGAGCTVENLK